MGVREAIVRGMFLIPLALCGCVAVPVAGPHPHPYPVVSSGPVVGPGDVAQARVRAFLAYRAMEEEMRIRMWMDPIHVHPGHGYGYGYGRGWFHLPWVLR